jgi:hypothetical protein
MYSIVMLRFMVQALQDPLLCSSTNFSAEERLFRAEKVAFEQKSHPFSAHIFFSVRALDLLHAGQSSIPQNHYSD